MPVKESILRRLEKAKKSKTFAALLLAEALLVLSLIVGTLIYWSPRVNIIPEPLNRYLFVSDIAAIFAGFVIIFYVLDHKDFVRNTVREKWKWTKQDRRIPGLLLVEYVLSMALVLATFIYLDPDYNVIPWPFNIFVFLGILGIIAYLYHYSKPFRNQSRGFFAIRKRW